MDKTLGSRQRTVPCLTTPNVPTTPPERTFPEKVDDTLWSFVGNVEVSVGVGLGLYGAMELFDLVGVDLGLYITCCTVSCSDWNVFSGQESYMGMSLSFLWWDWGIEEDGCCSYDGEWVFTSRKGFAESESLTIAEGALFLYGGGKYRLGFKSNRFLYELEEIWG